MSIFKITNVLIVILLFCGQSLFATNSILIVNLLHGLKKYYSIEQINDDISHGGMVITDDGVALFSYLYYDVEFTANDSIETNKSIIQSVTPEGILTTKLIPSYKSYILEENDIWNTDTGCYYSGVYCDVFSPSGKYIVGHSETTLNDQIYEPLIWNISIDNNKLNIIPSTLFSDDMRDKYQDTGPPGFFISINDNGQAVGSAYWFPIIYDKSKDKMIFLLSKSINFKHDLNELELKIIEDVGDVEEGFKLGGWRVRPPGTGIAGFITDDGRFIMGDVVRKQGNECDYVPTIWIRKDDEYKRYYLDYTGDRIQDTGGVNGISNNGKFAVGGHLFNCIDGVWTNLDSIHGASAGKLNPMCDPYTDLFLCGAFRDVTDSGIVVGDTYLDEEQLLVNNVLYQQGTLVNGVLYVKGMKLNGILYEETQTVKVRKAFISFYNPHAADGKYFKALCFASWLKEKYGITKNQLYLPSDFFFTIRKVVEKNGALHFFTESPHLYIRVPYTKQPVEKGVIEGQILLSSSENTQIALEDIRVYLDINNNEQLEDNEPTSITHKNGFYLFGNLNFGSYTVCVQLPEVQKSYNYIFPEDKKLIANISISNPTADKLNFLLKEKHNLLEVKLNQEKNCGVQIFPNLFTVLRWIIPEDERYEGCKIYITKDNRVNWKLIKSVKKNQTYTILYLINNNDIQLKITSLYKIEGIIKETNGLILNIQ